jgi:hypothetical protein
MPQVYRLVSEIEIRKTFKLYKQKNKIFTQSCSFYDQNQYGNNQVELHIG